MGEEGNSAMQTKNNKLPDTAGDTCEHPGNCNIVLVEDDEMLSMVMSMQLEAAGFNFCAAADGYQALSLIRSHKPKIVLLDVTMPGLNGFELIDIVRGDPDLADLSKMTLIVHTSLDLSAAERKLLFLDGRTEFVTKASATDKLGYIVSKAYAEML